MPTLTTARLQLSPFEAGDLEELLDLFTHAEVRRFLLDDQIVTRAWVADEIDGSRARFDDIGCGLWSVRETGRTSIIGFTGFRYFFEPPELQLLYGFLSSHWGRGLATEAARAAVQHGFEVLGFEDVRAATDVPNAASVRVLERLGMAEWRRTDEGPAGTIFYRVARPEWERSTGLRPPAERHL